MFLGVTRTSGDCHDCGGGATRNEKGEIPERKRGADDSDGHEGVGAIHPAEINLVKHYLSTVCPGDVYEKFGFEEFFKIKMVRKTHRICKDPDNAHITLALRCLTCLTEPRTSKTEKLHAYAKSWLQVHLESTDLSLADRELKTEAGVLLEKLFSDEYASNSLLKLLWDWQMNPETSSLLAEDTPLSWKRWVFSDSGVNVIDKWLKDSAALH